MSAEVHAKQVAQSYRRLAQGIASGEVPDPQAALAALDEHWQGHGAKWVVPCQVPLDLDAWLAAGEVADVLGIAARRLRDWARYGHVRCYVADGVHRYSVGDVVNYQRRRAKRVVRPVTETAGNVM